MTELPVRIKSTGAIGILIGTHLVPVEGPPSVGLDAKGQLTQGPSQRGVQGFGVIALPSGFAVGPLADLEPMLKLDKSPGGEEPQINVTWEDGGDEAGEQASS